MQILNKEQLAGKDTFFDFLNSNAHYMAISGPPGTGKTFLLGQLSDIVLSEYKNTCTMLNIEPMYNQVIFAATTNKAAAVLEDAINKPAKTIQSILSLRVTENFKTGKTDLKPTDATMPIDRSILFIDESSMIDTALYDIIMEMTKTSKVIFVGDHAQLAPVLEKISPVYQNLSPAFHIELTEPVRNAGSPALVTLCDQLRNSVETGKFHPIQEVPGSIDYLENDDAVIEKLQEYFVNSDGRARIVCYTNQRVNEFNQAIRTLRNQPNKFQVGEHLVVATAYARKKVFLNVEREVEVLEISQSAKNGGYSDVGRKGESLEYYDITIRPKTGLRDIICAKLPVNRNVYNRIIKRLSSQKLWPEYFTLKNEYIDLRGRDACTIYKSQGSTYEAVFLDLGNIGTSFDAEQVARSLFVAVSRAQKNVFLYGNLPQKYIGTLAA